MPRFQKGRAKTGGRKPGVVNKATVEIRETALSLLEDPRYQERLRERLLAGKCPPQIEALLLTSIKPIEVRSRRR